MSVSKDLVDIIKGSDSKGTKAYDTTATVTRVEDSTVWVHIPGGVDETPVKKTISAKQGDTVQVRVSGGSAWLNGNASAPPTDDTQANLAVEYALVANNAADSAVKSANIASEAAADAKATADSVHGIAVQAQADADEAKVAAGNASEYAARALGNLSTVQSVTETLNWITQHGTMALTTDVALDPTHVYFVQDAGGDYVVGGVTYAIVTEPDVDDIGTYYELTIDESLNNYVGTHLALTSEGLWLLPAASGTNKVLIAHGNGSVYTTAGTYLIDASGNAVASFRANGATMSASNGTQIAHLGYGPGDNGSGGTAYAPYYTFGIRNSNTHGNYSVAEGYMCVADSYSSHAEGAYCNAKSTYTHAEGNWTNATAGCAHAEGRYSLANALAAHAEGYGQNSSSHTNATGQGSHAEGCVSSGYSIVASGLGAHAEGDATTTNILASGNGSHAEGGGTTASGLRAHAEGSFTTASGLASHSSGRNTIASGDCSHAQNLFTKASSDNQTALGKFNIEDSTDTYAVIIGNGTADNARSNALTVDWDGKIQCGDYSGTLTSIFDLFYPVGSYYETSDTTFDPNVKWGGTWVLETEGQVHVSAGANYTAGDTGGSATHTHTTGDFTLDTTHIPAHTHGEKTLTGYIQFRRYGGTANSGTVTTATGGIVSASSVANQTNYANIGVQTNVSSTNHSRQTINATHTHNSVGGGSAHNHGDTGSSSTMQPYIVVNRWHRTA